MVGNLFLKDYGWVNYYKMFVVDIIIIMKVR